MANEVRKNRWIRRTLRVFLGVFIFFNIIVAFQAWSFTHIAPGTGPTLKQIEQMSAFDKAKALVLGVSAHRKPNDKQPSVRYETVKIEGHKDLQCWFLPHDSAIGSVAVFHGHLSCKSQMIDRAEALHAMGYRVLMVDHRAHGDSEGEICTIGYQEAEDVVNSFWYLKDGYGTQPVYLIGSSMGAASVMRAVADLDAQPDKIMLECPFGTMQEATEGRVRIMGLPTFPISHMLLFWGGVETGFWPFDHKPVDYATRIKCPTLLMWGEQDPRVMKNETDGIFSNLAGPKTLVTFPNSGHESYLNKEADKWKLEVNKFLKS